MGRYFTKSQKNEIWAQQNGLCKKCKQRLDPRTVEYDHKKEWSRDGRSNISNGQALCANCHKLKTHRLYLKKGNKIKRSKKDKFGLTDPKDLEWF